MSNNNGAHPPEDDFLREGRRIQELVEKIGGMPDPAAREMLQDCLGSVLSFYGHGLRRIMELVGENGGTTREILLNDPGVRGLLLIHGLHPEPLEARLRDALEKVRPYMKSHGGDVELLSLQDDFARLRLVGHCKTCPSSTVTLELAVRAAIEEACPDLQGFDVEGIQPENAAFEHVPKAAPEWLPVTGTENLREGRWLKVQTKSEPILVCKVDGQLYAYRDHCPACNLPLHLGELHGDEIICSLGHRFDLKHAGAGIGHDIHLDPLPLMTRDGGVHVVQSRAEENHANGVHP
jgi:Fe-S cluster biogenesis protein NfuA/nitrite reductase/ring-hydroxylating ferredoxin subunit